MKKELRNKKKKGFTLIELIVVIVILGVLALVVVPRVGGFTKDAAISSHNANVRTLHSAAMMYAAEHPGTAVTSASEPAALNDYIQSWPKVPKGTYGGKTHDGKGTYTVGITDKGVVTVTPDLVTK